MRGVDPKLRAEIRKKIEADYGQHTIMPGNRIPPVRRLRSGSIALDYIMGGGVPFGAITRSWGGFSTGKTTEMFNIFREAQHQGLKVMYVCTEKIFDQKLAEQLGVRLDKDHFEIVMTRRIEQIGEIVSDALLGYHVIGVDSTTGCASVEEYGHKDGIMGESATVGMTRARKWGYNLDWWQDRITHENALLLTTQIQSRIGMSAQQRVDQERAPGGEKLNHEPAVMLHFMKGAWLKRRSDGGLEQYGEKGGEQGAFGRGQAAGGEVIVRCDKNKTGVSHRVCLLHHDKRAANFDRLHELEKFAKYFGVVQRTTGKSSWYLLPGGAKTQSLRARLEEDEDLVRAVEEVVYRCAADPQYESSLLRGDTEPLVPQLAVVS